MKLTLPLAIFLMSLCVVCAGAFASSGLLIAPAHAELPEGRAEVFEAGAFAAAQAEGHPILVDITASWCPTCRRQGEIIGSLLENGGFADLVIFEVDWDEQRAIARGFGAPRQSTLIVYDGTQETGRVVAAVRAADIEALLLTAYGDQHGAQ